MSKLDPSIIFDEANDFLIASDIIIKNAVPYGLRETLGTLSRSMGLTHVAYMNHALSFELYLKCLLVLCNKIPSKTHSLPSLFRNIPEKIKIKISLHFDQKYRYNTFYRDKNGWPKQDSFEVYLKEIVNPFERFRYMYEIESNFPMYQLKEAISSVRETILELRPDFIKSVHIE